ncbi:uncharacterized protein AB675_6952 [Cyphellophora attinorum]|uniref:Uncharacterized protein n=1 Tax=Cyphellophora attinorum TaxID=1664694 RepID=A0A0N0NQF7_9EURO|nr:uncharacterized protein AB675_6952 [Phialophora attinorum]KPI43649.1 hypothetical protein AB675_6952 [Phialophora attinorum]
MGRHLLEHDASIFKRRKKETSENAASPKQASTTLEPDSAFVTLKYTRARSEEQDQAQVPSLGISSTLDVDPEDDQVVPCAYTQAMKEARSRGMTAEEYLQDFKREMFEDSRRQVAKERSMSKTLSRKRARENDQTGSIARRTSDH